MFGAKVISNLASGVVVVITARALGPAGRGTLVMLMTVGLFSALIGTLGVNMAARVHLVSADQPVSMRGYLGLATALSALQFVICSLVGIVLLPLADTQADPPTIAALALFGASLLFAYLLLDGLYASGKINQAVVADSLGSGGQLVLCFIAVGLGSRSVTVLLLTLVAGNLMQVGATARWLGTKAEPLAIAYDKAEWTLLLRRGTPALGFVLGQLGAFRLDRYLAGVFLDSAAVGVYSVAATSTELLRWISFSWTQVIFHRLASRTVTADVLGYYRRRIFGAVTVAGVALAIAAPVLVRALFGEAFLGAVRPLRILVFAELAMALFFVDSTGVAALGHFRQAAYSSLAGLAIVAVADVLLLPTLGIDGAAIASVIAYSAMAVVARVMLKRVSRTPGPASG